MDLYYYVVIIGSGYSKFSDSDLMFMLLQMFVAWLIAGIFGFIGYLRIIRALQVAKLKLAAHMFRVHSLYAWLAVEKGNKRAEELVEKMASREYDFVYKTFSAAGINLPVTFATNLIESAKAKSEPPYIIVYRNGVFDAPSTLVANVVARLASATVAMAMLIIFGVAMLAGGILLTAITVYSISKKLKNHILMENTIRQELGLVELPVNTPGAGGMILSILTAGFYLPIYTSSFSKALDYHITSH